MPNGPMWTRSSSDRSGAGMLDGWDFARLNNKWRIGNDHRMPRAGMTAWLPGAAEPALLAANHDYRAMQLLGSRLRRAVHLFRASGQIGKLKLQGREVGGFFGWRCPGSHQLRFLVAGGQSVNQQDSGAGFGMGLWPARFHWLAILGFWKRQLSRVCGAGESAKRNGRACAGRSIRVRGDKSSTKAGDWQLTAIQCRCGELLGEVITPLSAGLHP